MLKHTTLFLHLCLTALLLTVFSISAQAQNTVDWETYFEQLTAMEDTENDNWENAYEIISQLAASPIDINSATREDLERIPFLTNTQIEDICQYLYRYGRMQTLGELMLIESLDEPRRHLLECLVLPEQSLNAHSPNCIISYATVSIS